MSGKRLASRNSPQRSLEELKGKLLTKPGGAEAWNRITRLLLTIPENRTFFFQRFGARSIRQVLRQVDRSREWLKQDFLLSPEQKAIVESSIRYAENLAWNALMEANFPQVKEWTLEGVLVPNEPESNDRRPSFKIVAWNRDTGEKRQIVIPREVYCDLDRRGLGLKDAFQQLGLFKLLWQGSVRNGLVSARQPQAWPLFTQNIVPALYEILIPFYPKTGNVLTQKDDRSLRLAYFPKQLFADMREILRQMRPDVFVNATPAQLIATIQRHLDRKQEITNFKE